MPKKPQKVERVESDLSQKEAEQKRDVIIKRMLTTQPKPKKAADRAKK